MSKIRIKNFGPIKEGYTENDGWIDIKKVTVFIGNQGSGKSTVAKLISTFTWLEKALNRGDIDKNITFSVINECLEYMQIENYYRENTIIEYAGDAWSISTNEKRNHEPKVKKSAGNYVVPKIMYVPAERNLWSTITSAYNAKNLPEALVTFGEELKKGQLELKEKKLDLPIGDMKFRYDEQRDTSYIIGEDYELDLLKASSGYQSFVPLYLVSKFLTDYLQKGQKTLREQLSVTQSIRRNKEIVEVTLNDSLSDDEKRLKVKEIDAKYISICFINIVEEPEQNLFPSSQHRVLNSLIAFNNMNEGNKLIMTTHSPYLINDISLAVKANQLKEELSQNDLKERVNKIVPLQSTIDAADLAIYEMNENGSISKLGSYEGIPSDKNFLNQLIGVTNKQFDSLLEIEEEL